jgi:hypothetical protein
VVDLTTSSQSEEINKLSGHLWKPLKALMNKARQEREKALAQTPGGNSVNERDVFASTSRAATVPKQPPGNFIGPDSLMTMDFGVDRLYPTADLNSSNTIPTTSAIQDPTTMWQQSTFAMSPMSGTIPIGATLDSTVMSTVPPEQPNFGMLDTEMQGLPTVSTSTSGWTPNESFSINDSTMMDDGSVNWATWDDMVQMYAMQNEASPNEQGHIPSFYTTGSNIF